MQEKQKQKSISSQYLMFVLMMPSHAFSLLKFFTRLSLCLCLARGGCSLGKLLLQRICSCTESPELQLLYCQQPAGGLKATSPRQRCLYRYVEADRFATKLAEGIVSMICITQNRAGCGFKGIWLSFAALQFTRLLLIKLFGMFFVASMWEYIHCR